MRKSDKFEQKLRCYAEDNMNLTASSNRQGGYTQQPLHCDKKPSFNVTRDTQRPSA